MTASWSTSPRFAGIGHRALLADAARGRWSGGVARLTTAERFAAVITTLWIAGYLAHDFAAAVSGGHDRRVQPMHRRAGGDAGSTAALSVGLCLAHMVTDKQTWLERLGVGVEWPMSGKPRELYLDNAAEYKSEALGRPHFRRNHRAGH